MRPARVSSLVCDIVIAGAMAETEAERFRKEAEECIREAERAISPLDRESWLRMAKQWSKLAKEAEQRRPTF